MFDRVIIGLRKYWNRQSEAKLKQIIAIVKTHSVFVLYLQQRNNFQFYFLI